MSEEGLGWRGKGPFCFGFDVLILSGMNVIECAHARRRHTLPMRYRFRGLLVSQRS